jgi:hypothetical protein
VPIRRSTSFSPTRHRSRSVIPSNHRNQSNFAVIGPNEKFSSSQLYRLRQPIDSHAALPKPKEFALLGRNEKFQDNIAYPLRKPLVDDTPYVSEQDISRCIMIINIHVKCSYYISSLLKALK